MNVDQIHSKTDALAGKYLTFLLGRESYGIKVRQVREIIRLTGITRVPQMPDHVLGVINLRGRIIPVLDLRRRFGLEPTSDNESACIIVVDTRQSSGNGLQMGVVVDAMEEVVNLGSSDLEETPEFGIPLDTAYILGMAKVKGAIKTLIDIDKVLAADAEALAERSSAQS